MEIHPLRKIEVLKIAILLNSKFEFVNIKTGKL